MSYCIAVAAHASNFYDADYNVLRASIRAILDSTNTDELPATKQKLFAACRAVVCQSQRGQGLYESLKLSLEQSVGKAANQLLSSARAGGWLRLL